MFDWDKGDNLTYHTTPPSGIGWNFSLELKRTELQ